MRLFTPWPGATLAIQYVRCRWSAFSSLSHLWADHRLSRTTKLRLYRVCVCSSLTHCCEAWTLNRTVMRSINGFNSRCLHVMTGEHYRETATAPAYDLVLVVRRRRLRYFGHVLRMPTDRMVRCALMALVSDYMQYPTSSLFSDCQGVTLPQLVAMASNRAMWRARVALLSWTCMLKWFLVLLLYHRTLGVYNEPEVSLRLALSIWTLCHYRQNTETHRQTETQSQ